MEKYDVISVVGEGSYGLVMRCRHRESGQYVAIKKFLETEDDPTVRKMALREIRMLKKLRHENLVNMLEVFRRKKRFFLVFEYLEHTVLEQLEARVGGLGFVTSRKYCYQVLRALDFIHSHDVIHRDIKPENVLVSRLGIIKLCDFGFARPYAENETFTDYVATRWYRSPELLVGDPRYGKEVDIWAVGCLYAEMMTGEPLFPGESDIDQLFQIIRVCGKLNARHQLLVTRNTMFKGMKQEQNTTLHQMFPDWSPHALDFLQQCLKMDGAQLRPDTGKLLAHALFTGDSFHELFAVELRAKLAQEMQGTPLLKRMPSYGGSGRKAAAAAAAAAAPQSRESKKSGDGKRSGDDRTAAVSRHIGLTIGKPESSAHRRLSTSTGDEVGLNLAALRQYLHQHQKPPPAKPQMININNLIFKDAQQHTPSNTAPGTRARVVSAKPPTKADASLADRTASIHMDTVGHHSQHPPASSPVHFQSLQPESLLQLGGTTASSSEPQPSGQHHQTLSKRLSPVSVSNLSVNGTAAPPQYFSHRRSSNILGLQHVAAAQKTPAAQQKHNNAGNAATTTATATTTSKKRERLIDVALMPLGVSTQSDGITAATNKDISPRLLPPSWLTTGNHQKISGQTEGGKSVHTIGKRGMTDWKSTTATNTGGKQPLTHHQHHQLTIAAATPPTTHSHPSNTPADAGSGLFSEQQLLLPSCPGATGVSPYKPRMHSKVKLSPLAADFHQASDHGTEPPGEGRK